MPKKKSKSKAAKETTETPAKPLLIPEKKPGAEIDEIFSRKKRKKSEQKKADQNEAEKPKSIKKKMEDEEGRFTDPPAKSRKKTADGFTIYTEEELGLANSNAGSTPLCPFDCDCCF